MIKRSLATGLLVGSILVLFALYPVRSLSTRPLALDGSSSALDLGLTPLLVLTLTASIVMVGLVGSLAAWRGGATDARKGFQSGAVSGLVVGTMFYAFVLAPTTAVVASVGLWAYLPTPRAPSPPQELVVAFLNQLTRGMLLRMMLCLLAGVLLGGIEGAFVGHLFRRKAVARPSLLSTLDMPPTRRRLFLDNDEVWRSGLLAGLLGGSVVWLSLTAVFLGEIESGWPQIGLALQARTDIIGQFLHSDLLLTCLLPLFLLAILGTGALAVLLVADPPSRHLSRFQVVLIAAVTVAVMAFLALSPVVYAGMGMARYDLFALVRSSQPQSAVDPTHLDPGWLYRIWKFVRLPEMSAPFFYLAPVALLAVVLLLVMSWFTPQAMFYGLTLPLVFRRPVDRAARISRAVQSQPTSLLPRLYQLYVSDDKAVQVLPHLASLLKDPAQARLVAAHYALGQGQAEIEQATSVIRHTIAKHQDWRWQAEISELYRVLEEGLAARTLIQVMTIQPPPQETTSTLPVLLARSCEGIARVLGELKKVERVDDLGTKLIFLNSAQAALHDLRRKTDREGQDCPSCETPFPEVVILHSLIDSWQGFVLAEATALQGRADLWSGLLIPCAGLGPRVRQCVVITNRGLNVAQHVRLEVADGQGYQIIEGDQQQIDILGPQESRELEFWIYAESARRLRLTWRLIFDDAVDDDRQVEFADAMDLEMDRAEHPFQRIFPIPYVTGTPLRSGEMFVGREDVFAFVREHLLGTYQNNVIVLHGQRRTGKTSILYRLGELLADTHVAVLVDMQGKAARGMADLLYAVSDDIAYGLAARGLGAELPDRSDYERSPEFTFRSRFLRSIVDALGSRNLLLMFDEFEELQSRVEDGRLEPEILPFLRNLIQHEPRVDFLFSGTRKLESLGSEYWSILFNIASYKRITFLDPDEVRRLVVEPVAPYGMEYDPLAIERIVQVTAGHPYFVQVVCHEMVAYHNETERNYLTVTSVDQVLERIIERGEAHFKYIWAGATPEEHQLMLALTDLLPDTDSAATLGQIARELEQKGQELAPDALNSALARLLAKDILGRPGPRSSLYRFKIDLIRRWIATARPAL